MTGIIDLQGSILGGITTNDDVMKDGAESLGECWEARNSTKHVLLVQK